MAQQTTDEFLNGLAADIDALRCVVQVFVAQLLTSHPKGSDLFADLQNSVCSRLNDEVSIASSDEFQRRKAAMTLDAAQEIFAEMAPLFKVPSRRGN